MSIPESTTDTDLIKYIVQRGGRYFLLDILLGVVTPIGFLAGVFSFVYAWTDESISWALFGLLSLVSAVVCMRLHRVVAAESRRRVMPTIASVKELPARSFVLYLRSFTFDDELAKASRRGRWVFIGRLLGFGDRHENLKTEEQGLFQLFGTLGNFVAVGHPDEPYPHLGAQRLYLPKEGWRPEVGALMRRARAVVFMAGIGPSESAEGTVWEFSEAVRTLPPSRVILLVRTARESYDGFREAITAEFSRRRRQDGLVAPRKLKLPDFPPTQCAGHAPLRGAIRFGEDWAPEFVGFTPAAEPGLAPRLRWGTAVRGQLRNLVAQLEERLPETVNQPEARWSRALAACVIVVASSAFSAYLMLQSPNAPGLEKTLNVLLVTLPAIGVLRGVISGELFLRIYDVKVTPTGRK
ncbi:hypothetical protein ACFQ68_07430 [Amycolatopsis japonica]|uniref:hypothetical protein n=1 Tax=Amycolatopsis japonica TaxID=208439 RepID=UPI003670D3B8